MHSKSGQDTRNWPWICMFPDYFSGRIIVALEKLFQFRRCPQQSQKAWYSRSIIIPHFGQTGKAVVPQEQQMQQRSVTGMGSRKDISRQIADGISKSLGVRSNPTQSFSSVKIVGAVLPLTMSPKYLELSSHRSEAASQLSLRESHNLRTEVDKLSKNILIALFLS